MRQGVQCPLMEKLTEKQRQVLAFIGRHAKHYGYPPTRVEIAEQVLGGAQNANSAHEHVKALERKGYVEVMPGVARGIKVLEAE